MPRQWVEMAHEKRAHLFPTYWYWKSVQRAAKIVGTPPGLFGCWYKDHEMGYITEMSGFTRMGEVIAHRIAADPDFVSSIEKSVMDGMPRLIQASEWFGLHDLQKKSNEELAERYESVYEEFLRLHEYGILGTIMEFERPVLSEKVEHILRQKVGGDMARAGNFFSTLTTPDRMTTPLREEIDLRKLRIKQLAGEMTENELQDHVRHYSFIAFGYDGPGWSPIEIRERLENLPADQSIIEQEIQELSETPEKNKRAQATLEAQLSFTSEEGRMIHGLRILAYWKFERKLANQKSHEYLECFIEELMRRFQLSKAQAKMISPAEAVSVLVNGGVDHNLLNDRLKLSFALFEGYDHEEIMSGDQAQALEKEIEQSLAVDSTIQFCQGACAYPGQVRGMVKRIDHESEMDKFNSGDILVATSTTPKLIAIMKKAAAIVTDSGGITCHAAIVAREIKKPCVIGTRYATHFLKDGDMVEVDANHGVVRKI